MSCDRHNDHQALLTVYLTLASAASKPGADNDQKKERVSAALDRDKMEEMLDGDVARIVAVHSETIEVQLQLQSDTKWITVMLDQNVHMTVAEKIGCRVGQINRVAFGDEQVPEAASFASIEIDDGGRLAVDCTVGPSYTPAEAVAKLRQIPGVKDYDAEGPPTETSVSFERQSFETLPEVS